MPEPVLFYGHRDGPYAAFSNFYPARFVLDGHTWACSEQAFMSFKSNDSAFQQAIRATSDPSKAKRLGRSCPLRPDWDSVKYDVMVRVLNAKFAQNPVLAQLLLSTETRSIHENCSDPWWGGGPNFPRGRDLLGKALMQVRETLRQTSVSR